MRIENVGRCNREAGSKNQVNGNARWEGTFVGCLILLSVFGLIFLPFGGRSAAPGLQIGPSTNIGGVTYITVTITNGSGTNTYQIDRRVQLNANVPWVGSITGIPGQTNFSIQIGPEQFMFYRALDCDDCDHDGIPNSRDGNPVDANIGILTIQILSPTNGATVY